MLVYEGYKLYGPYKRQDNRQHVILIHYNELGQMDDRKTISYPKYIVEKHINRYLLPNETIDHIDGNFSNNELSNLRIIPRSEHVRSHVYHRIKITKQCIICGKLFETTDNRRITCGSKVCRGKCAHLDGHNKGNSIKREKNKLILDRSLVEEILPVEDAKSGKAIGR